MSSKWANISLTVDGDITASYNTPTHFVELVSLGGEQNEFSAVVWKKYELDELECVDTFSHTDFLLVFEKFRSLIMSLTPPALPSQQ